jgi:hypothetical protein
MEHDHEDGHSLELSNSIESYWFIAVFLFIEG